MRKIVGDINNDKAEAGISIVTIVWFLLFVFCLTAALGFCSIYIDSAALKHKVNNELNNISVQISKDAYQDLKEKNTDSYKESFLSRKTEYQTQFHRAVKENIPVKTGYYVVDPDAVKLEYETVTEEAVTYRAVLRVTFQLNLFGQNFKISTGDVAVQGVHSFKQGSAAVDDGTGSGNQYSDSQLK